MTISKERRETATTCPIFLHVPSHACHSAPIEAYMFWSEGKALGLQQLYRVKLRWQVRCSRRPKLLRDRVTNQWFPRPRRGGKILSRNWPLCSIFFGIILSDLLAFMDSYLAIPTYDRKPRLTVLGSYRCQSLRSCCLLRDRGT